MKYRIIDTLKDLPIEMKCMTEGKPYAHILNGGLKKVSIEATEDDIKKICNDEVEKIKTVWNKNHVE